ncbi:ATP-binding cassette domain-containing protein [Hymenobacter sp. BT523]|uniref:ABC transporter ATP-binding protein n=1 Tax=Hymenobacter sp. BT523 TaxID=2795725 RepID=UPI0018EB421B|nr:ABC transporter ATP-binding protein [Hymenobacter sp. BT523]MBJ6111068.1 ATP-binding cassette domain-containing protein [Hymenobacter sp. BT523]
MSIPAALQVEHLGKLYRLGEVGTGTLSQDLNRAWARLRKREDPYAKIGEANDRSQKGDSDFVWSLRDVSFAVPQGEVLGIIGPNGSGKSTLLKILSKVTAPTTGRVKLRGRVASLLEVGTGFHPELTGRENVFLNGAILGMSKAEIRAKFDEIVDFSGVERYIDTPVKRYSSGMYVRLAFAVAAFLEPEIMIVDEVLAVGDAEFQRKCLGRLQEVSRNDGKTVLFVSHDMNAVQNLCTQALLLEQGQVSCLGPTAHTIAQYAHARKQQAAEQWHGPNAPAQALKLTDAVMLGLTQDEKNCRFTLALTYCHNAPHPAAFVAIDVADSAGSPLMQALPTLDKFLKYKPDGTTQVHIQVELPPLVPGEYYLSFWAGSHNTETLDFEDQIVRFDIIASPTKGRTFPHTRDHGAIVPYAQVLDCQ